MKLRSIAQVVRLRGKRVIVRCDLNASVTNGVIAADDRWKLQRSMRTIQYLVRRKAKVIIISHRGRPRGKDHDVSLEPIVKAFAKMLKQKIHFWDDTLEAYAGMSHDLAPGAIACLENIRFFKGEEENDEAFAKKLARVGDIYVNDAFGNIHRTHASMVAITRHLPSYAGFLLQYEVQNLHSALSRSKKPIVAIVGGNKISTKIILLKKLLRKVDYVLLGGALANNVLAAFEYNVGKSKIESDMLTWSKGLMSNRLKVPVDARVASSLRAKPRIAAVGSIRASDIIYDLGPDTIALYKQVVERARTVIWNGPLGYFEDPRYAHATRELVKILARSKAKAYVGGGETVKAVLMERAEKKLHFISTGGGAMLAFLEGKPCPGLRAVSRK